MTLTRNNHDASSAVLRMAVLLVVAVTTFVNLTADSAFAASILTNYSVSSAELRHSLERLPDLIGSSFEVAMGNEDCGVGCGSVATDGRTDVVPLTDPKDEESHNQVEFAPMHSGTSSNDSSPGSTLSSGTVAVLGVVHQRSASALIGWLQIELSLDVPVAPPFELLRPPQV